MSRTSRNNNNGNNNRSNFHDNDEEDSQSHFRTQSSVETAIIRNPRRNNESVLLLYSKNHHQAIFDKYANDDGDIFDFESYLNELSILAEQNGVVLSSEKSPTSLSNVWAYLMSLYPSTVLASSYEWMQGLWITLLSATRYKTSSNRRTIGWIFLITLILLIIIVPTSIKVKNKKTTKKALHSATTSGDGDGQSTSNIDYKNVVLQSFPPFSTLDPVNDLNVYRYGKRPDQSKPSSSRIQPLRQFRQFLARVSATSRGNVRSSGNSSGGTGSRQSWSEQSSSSSFSPSFYDYDENDQDTAGLTKVFSSATFYDESTFAAGSDSSVGGGGSGSDGAGAAIMEAALPTNAWYQPMIPRNGSPSEPSKDQRVYTIPYIIDAAGTIPGVRIHKPRIVGSSSTQVTTTIDEPYALTVGFTTPSNSDGSHYYNEDKLSAMKSYKVTTGTDLGVTLQWDDSDDGSGSSSSTNGINMAMESTLVRGMPYATMVYHYNRANAGGMPFLWPTIVSEQVNVDQPILVDQIKSIQCDTEPEFTVQSEIQLSVGGSGSGHDWILFFSQPVTIACQIGGTNPFMIQVIDVIKGESTHNNLNANEDGGSSKPLIVRVASLFDYKDSEAESYANLLRDHSAIYPGKLTNVLQSVLGTTGNKEKAIIAFDWNAQSMSSSSSSSTEEMIMFALPHHQDVMISDGNTEKKYCAESMVGPVCIYKGNSWTMEENLPNVSFQAPRHPDPTYILDIAEALMDDINYRIADNYVIGAGDTYFSGKRLAKLARILLIYEELDDICSGSYDGICNDMTLPSDDKFQASVSHLRDATEIWLNGKGQAPFVYDSSWGGMVSCGCKYDSGQCSNRFPDDDCPAFTDQGLNYGNAYYNDHHFHYGYHVYAAAALSHFDHQWGIENFENALMLVRDFANPSTQDLYFTTYRNKDWYRGHSWASGITDPIFPNGLNQESSSEAIAAYEAVALFGKTMASVFQEAGDADKAALAETIHDVGLTLTATEIRSTQKYWQVQPAGGKYDGQERRVYPDSYEPFAVGILWSTMVQFTTWFGNQPYLIYGIQLLPLTPISEHRDNIEWSKRIYSPLSQSCNQACVSEGWSVQVAAILATIGHKDQAVEHTKKLSPSSYDSAGGSGHSRTNTLWYIATRPEIDDPYPLEDIQTVDIVELNCSQPARCTNSVLNAMAGDYTCRQRIEFLMNAQGMSQAAACNKVAISEYPIECGTCDPNGGRRFLRPS